MAPARARSAEAQEPRTEPTAAESETRETGGTGPTAAGAEREGGGRGATVNLPFVTAQFHKPDLHLPRMRRPDLGATAGAAAAKARSLSPADLAYYAGLGALTAFELIEWPVALAIGAGTALARSGRSSGERHAGDRGNGADRGPGDAESGRDRGTPGTPEGRTETGGQG
ncbi:hypothetical protein [Pseudonocardia acidicola]|uniref:hypothetical protein n=1 Tax=Pseudonocardia acidicola TaxID=2724939 RepID=UPI001B7CEF82|nr:hypothetical protein [Pseudonocardia acidicola]